jgi:hypothetical protein
MIFFFKKPKIEFLSTVDTALHIHPIEPSNFARPKWLEVEAAHYVADNKVLNVDSLTARTIAKCRGIRDLYKTGWVVRAWQDIYVDAKDNGSLEWRTPTSQEKINGEVEMSAHSSDTFKHCPHLSKQVPIIKLHNPWIVKIPKGYNILQLPMAYQDNSLFTTAMGMYDSDFGLMELNVQLFWHGRGPQIIKAGTPLAQYILVKKEKIPYEVRKATSEERQILATQQHIKQNTFKTNYVSMLAALKKLK